MELVERFSFFSFFARAGSCVTATWSEAEAHFGSRLVPPGPDPPERARSHPRRHGQGDSRSRALALRPGPSPWPRGETVAVPVDWFKLLNEFNGSSRRQQPDRIRAPGRLRTGRTPRLRPDRSRSAFVAHHRPGPAWMTRCSSGCWTPSPGRASGSGSRISAWACPCPRSGPWLTIRPPFPDASEIVFTAGTATSPVKAAIRALTEIAQLAGDFETNSNYEALGPAQMRRSRRSRLDHGRTDRALK